VGVKDILEQIVRKVPPPKGKEEAPLRALLFDSWYDSYRGAVAMVRVVDGVVKKGDKIRFVSTGTDYEITEMGTFRPFAAAVDELGPGEVGFVAANIKSVHDVKLGDTVTHAVNAPGRGPHHMGPTTDALPGF